MGLIPCFKPHYAILIIVIEFYKLWQEKSWRFFIELDKLIALLVLALYINFMIKFTPEFLEYMVPMWSEFYDPYANIKIFYNNLIRHLANKILLCLLIFPMFLRLKLFAIDKILLLVFISVSLLLMLENIGTVDQETIFFGFASICIFKFSYDFFSSKYFNFDDRKFIILCFVLIPIFDISNFFTAVFGIVKIWFIVIPIIFFVFFRKQKISYKYLLCCGAIYFILAACSIYELSLISRNENLSNLLNIFSFLVFLYIFETFYNKSSDKFSPLLVIVVAAVLSYFSYFYILAIEKSLSSEDRLALSMKINDDFANSIKFYAPKPEDSYMVSSNWILDQFPLMNYLKKPNYFKYAIVLMFDDESFNATTKPRLMFSAKPERAFTYGYLFDDFKKQLKNPNIKIIFFNQGEGALNTKNHCNIRLLEYYLQDSEFRKIFLKNFRFQNRIIEYKKVPRGLKLLTRDSDKFDEIKLSQERISHDFEVYVRK